MMISLCSVLLVSKVLYKSYDALLAIGFTWSSKWLAIHTPQEGKHMAHISLGYLHILCISLQHMTTFITFFWLSDFFTFVSITAWGGLLQFCWLDPLWPCHLQSGGGGEGEVQGEKEQKAGAKGVVEGKEHVWDIQKKRGKSRSRGEIRGRDWEEGQGGETDWNWSPWW